MARPLGVVLDRSPRRADTDEMIDRSAGLDRAHALALEWLDSLTDRPVPTGTSVHLEPVGAVAATLRAATPPAQTRRATPLSNTH